MGAWFDITGPSFWQAKVLVDTGATLPPASAPDGTKAAYYLLNDGWHCTSNMTDPPVYNDPSSTTFSDIFLDLQAVGSNPGFVFTAGSWVPSSQTAGSYVVPVLQYIGPTYTGRSDVRITLNMPATATGTSLAFGTPAIWSDVLDVPNNAFLASGPMHAMIPYTPTWDLIVGGSEVSTCGVGDAQLGIGGSGSCIFPAVFPGPDILSLLAFGTFNLSHHLVGVPTISKIEVFADGAAVDFWTDLVGCEQ